MPSMRHPGDTGARDFMPERNFLVTFKNGVKINVRAQSMEDARQKARKYYKDKWRNSFGTEAADVGISAVTTQG